MQNFQHENQELKEKDKQDVIRLSKRKIKRPGKIVTATLVLCVATVAMTVAIQHSDYATSKVVQAFPGHLSKIDSTGSTSAETSKKITLVENKVYLTQKEKYPLKIAKKPIETEETEEKKETEPVEKAEIVWESHDEEVVVVDDEGVITPIADGNTTVVGMDITSGETVACDVVVTLPVQVEEIVLSKKEFTLTSKNEKLKLHTTVLPKDAVEEKYTWTSSNEKVATVNQEGVVTAVGKGKADIICTTSQNVQAVCRVTMKPAVKAKSVRIDYEWLKFTGPYSPDHELKATVEPDNTTNKNVTWKSTDENVVKVDAKGNVSSVGNGTCKIICTTNDGSYQTASCDITVTGKNIVYSYDTSVYVPVNPEVANSIIEEAYRYVGVIPYVWGGTNLASGVDCSGFICAVYDRFGYNLWGLRTDLYMAGVEVPDISQAQAGDILCYKGHVAIYDGNGGRVHAPDEGYMVTHDYNLGGYYAIRRIIS